ncbi:DUF4139 domain-containing protein [Kitasatospora sp. McL0602]|uniref:DUF4139 domain-containing protein n=1 Tax=Kitasatospora sp. McL0602 TaxID=3439530 RepID=UPI003F8B8FBD
MVVHASGAVCRRRARGLVPPDGKVRLPGLPSSLDPGSLRATVTGGDGHRVTEARLEQAAELRRTEELPELRRAAERAREESEAARARHARQLHRIDEIAALRAIPPQRGPDDPHRRTPADVWLDLADFVDERLTRLQARADTLAEEHQQAEHVAAVAEEELARASTAEPAGRVATTRTAVLTLTAADSTSAAEVEIEIEYIVPGAVWVPTYRLSHRQGDGGGTLVLRASVAQRTGEDWTGVRLGLSTADLHRRSDLPRLHSIRIGRAQAAPAASGWREPPPGLGELFAGYDTAVPPAPRPAARRRSTGRPARAMRYDFGGPAPAVVHASGPRPGAQPVPPAPAAPAGAPAPDLLRSHAKRAAPAPDAAGGAGPAGPAGPAAPLMAPLMAAAPAPPPPPPAVEGPPRPAESWLDYASLVLDGPEQGDARRGKLRRDADPGLPGVSVPRTPPLPRHAVAPRDSAGSFDHRYDAAARVDLPSDGGWHSVTVGEIPVGLSREYVCVPAVEPTVYGVLVLANDTEQALLAGPVEVTADGEYLLTTRLPTLAPGGTRRLGLGVAEGIRVARRAELRESTAGLLNNTTVLDHRVHVELANSLDHPVTVEVRERVPVSTEAEVRIEERPGWSPLDPVEPTPPGLRRRRVVLPAQGTAELDGGYEIRIPAGKALLGGNRRN